MQSVSWQALASRADSASLLLMGSFSPVLLLLSGRRSNIA